MLDKAKAGDGYFGYKFRILTRQGDNVAGGAHDYIVNGKHDMLFFTMLAKTNGKEGRVAATRTRDGGKTWTDVTPPQVQPWAKVSILDTGYTDPLTAYAAINTIRLDDMRPHILRTHDGGKTWTEIVNGIPDGAPVNVVRPDPKKKGLLFAGTETTVYVSFDDGDHWQSLQLNLPATSMRDVAVKDNDLILVTHGRGFWVIDDISPLRQVNATVLASVESRSTLQAGLARKTIIAFEPAGGCSVRVNIMNPIASPVAMPTPHHGEPKSARQPSAISDAER
mgnify:CR=1 FL=1